MNHTSHYLEEAAEPIALPRVPIQYMSNRKAVTICGRQKKPFIRHVTPATKRIVFIVLQIKCLKINNL